MRISRSLQAVAAIAYISAVIHLLDIEVLLFSGPATPFVSLVLNLPMQLFYFFFVATLPSSSWARACGYSACILPLILLVALIHHLPPQVAIGFSYAVIAMRALWIAESSWQMKGITRIVGLALALLLASEALIPSLPQNLTVLQLLLISALFALWFLLVGHVLTSRVENLPRLLSFPIR